MSITAATTSKDRVYRSDAIKAMFESALPLLSSAVTFNQGDHCYLDTSGHLIKRVGVTGDAATYLGVAVVAVASGVLVSPYQGLATSASAAPMDAAGPQYGGVFSMVLATGDALTPGAKVYLLDGGTSQQVTVTDPGDHNYVGLYVGSTIASAAAGQEGQIKIGCRYPAATGAALMF